MRAFGNPGSIGDTLGAAILVYLISATVTASAQDIRKATGITSGDCQTTAQKFVVATKPVSAKTGGVFSLLPESISFVQGGTTAGCVTVSFTAESHVSYQMAVQVRPLLDGVATSFPSTAALGGNLAGYDSHGMNFIFTNVTPGRHLLRIEFAGIPSPASLQARSTILSYVK